jgi:hypothetical protein
MFFWGTFSGVSRQDEFKTTIKVFLQKVHVENLFQKIDTNFDVSFSSTFFVLSRFRVFLSDGSSKTLQKTFCKTNRQKVFSEAQGVWERRMLKWAGSSGVQSSGLAPGSWVGAPSRHKLAAADCVPTTCGRRAGHTPLIRSTEHAQERARAARGE